MKRAKGKSSRPPGSGRTPQTSSGAARRSSPSDSLLRQCAQAMVPCPSAETLRSYLSGTLNSAIESNVRAHLLNCEQCLSATDSMDLERPDEGETRLELPDLEALAHARVLTSGVRVRDLSLGDRLSLRTQGEKAGLTRHETVEFWWMSADVPVSLEGHELTLWLTARLRPLFEFLQDCPGAAIWATIGSGKVGHRSPIGPAFLELEPVAISREAPGLWVLPSLIALLRVAGWSVRECALEAARVESCPSSSWIVRGKGASSAAVVRSHTRLPIVLSPPSRVVTQRAFADVRAEAPEDESLELEPGDRIQAVVRIEPGWLAWPLLEQGGVLQPARDAPIQTDLGGGPISILYTPAEVPGPLKALLLVSSVPLAPASLPKMLPLEALLERSTQAAQAIQPDAMVYLQVIAEGELV